jgi:hypothetical protein
MTGPWRAPETRYLWYVDGALIAGAHPAVPMRRVGVFYLPRLKRKGTLGVDLFERQSDARRAATMQARAAQAAP